MAQILHQGYEQTISDINDRLDNLIQLIDSKKNFYNNIFFSDKEKDIPMNLYNINFPSSGQEQNYLDNNMIIKRYQFDKPNRIFFLPSSEESGEDGNDSKIPSFTKICDDVIDFKTLALIDENKPEDKELPKEIHPIIMFRGQDPLISLEKVLGFIKSNLNNVPYEIKIMHIFKNNENKSSLSFIIKFPSYKEVSLMKKSLLEIYKIKSTICYDRRELNSTQWICVIFRREAGGEARLNKFVQLMTDIYLSIPEKNKEFICNSIEGICKAKIDDNECIRKLGDMLYCAIKVESLDQALFLCIQYNDYYDMKVNLHYITYKMKKNSIPEVLTQKDIQNESKGMKKKYKEDGCLQNDTADFLFPRKGRILGKKFRRNKYKNDS